MNLDLLNFLPGLKRPLTLLFGVILFAWNEAHTAGYVAEVPQMAYSFLALFGFNALGQGQKNDLKKSD